MKPDEDASHADEASLVVRPVETDEPMLEAPEGTPVATAAPEEPAADARRPYLTADWSERFGPAGHFVDLTDVEAAAARPGELVEPTADQLKLRRR
jgi:hypothetical protein